MQLKKLTLLRPRPISYRNQFINLQTKSMDWFLYDIGLLGIPYTKRTQAQTKKKTLETNEKKKYKMKKEVNCNDITNRTINKENQRSKNKANVHNLGESMVKELNCYLLTRKIRHKHFLK